MSACLTGLWTSALRDPNFKLRAHAVECAGRLLKSVSKLRSRNPANVFGLAFVAAKDSHRSVRVAAYAILREMDMRSVFSGSDNYDAQWSATFCIGLAQDTTSHKDAAELLLAMFNQCAVRPSVVMERLKMTQQLAVFEAFL